MNSATQTAMSESPVPETAASFSRVRAALEILTVMVASLAGLAVGGSTGSLAMAPILGMVFALIAATLFLRREGRSWSDLGFPRRISWLRLIGYTLAAIGVTILAQLVVVGPVLEAMNAPAPDISVLTEAITGNTLNYVVFMVFVVWGSAGFGEELIARGFLLDRFSKLFGTPLAVVAQAAVFGLAHSYQGITGVVSIFVLALVFGTVYVRCGRNLWPLIVAHGLIDTIAITAMYVGQAELITGG